ncbi:MAG TPA: short-chain dehydrogenase [Firmicutes bacterium]|jgi:NAD(P)-dependent dehydrogenase (short-subunit alcohol dehydrogenase family)|nr:short-chain dehydrogenase [Bacillota bacterium]
MKLQNMVAVVTGGGSGIGASICHELAKEGAHVAVTDVRKDAAEHVASEIRQLNGNAQAWAFDVSKKNAVDAAAEEIKEKFGPIEIWVNSAGISKILPFLDHTEEIWDLTMNINLKGCFLGCQAAIRQMLPRKKGIIINMSSQSGKAGNSQYQAYCASKFGVIGITQSLAMEFAKDGIRVNAICPGVVYTPMWDQQMEDYAKKRNMDPKDVMPYLQSKIPLGRLGKASDIARTVIFLASDDSSYITGQAFNLSGGQIMH